jgi:hypothetical protein
MPANRNVGKLCFGLSVAALSSGTHAADPLGLYVGAAAGRATIRADGMQFVANLAGETLSDSVSISKNDTGWKVMLGVRPISLIGAELEYIDFGHPTTSYSAVYSGGASYRADLRATAPSAFGVLYAPIPVPAFDLYGKVGVSSLHSTVNATGGLFCIFPNYCPAVSATDLHRDQTETRLAYGAGVQVKLARFGIRAEYERISANTGDPSLMSLGIIWRFY